MLNDFLVGLATLIGAGGLTKIIIAFTNRKSPSLALAAADIKSIERLSARLEVVEKRMHLLEFACIKAGIDIEKLYKEHGV